jgi:hypothetical protein
VCRQCGVPYLGHHLTKECDDCRFKECAAPGCSNKIKKSDQGKNYCSKECRLSDPGANKMRPDDRVSATCQCGEVFPKYQNGSRRKYCSVECRKKYYTRPATSDEQKEKLRQAHLGKPKPRGYKQTEEHLIKRLGNGSIRASREELSLVPIMTKLGYVHTGEGAFWRRWNDGTLHNPDFVNVTDRKIVEYFGTYWHSVMRPKDEQYVINQWKEIGYDCVIIWDTDRQAFLDDPTRFL